MGFPFFVYFLAHRTRIARPLRHHGSNGSDSVAQHLIIVTVNIAYRCPIQKTRGREYQSER
jgi:hypothetical protein